MSQAEPKLTDLKVIHFAPIEPDVIVSELWTLMDKPVAEMIWGFDGSKKIYFSPSDGIEFDATTFASVIAREMQHLDEWAESLREPGGAWDPASDYYAAKTAEFAGNGKHDR